VCADSPVRTADRAVRLELASSNAGKLREYLELAGSSTEIVPLANFQHLPPFDESAPTFAENAAGKALHYSRFSDGLVLADDSGLVVPALGAAPGVHSARYAGPNATDEDRYAKLLRAMSEMQGDLRRAHFVCVVAIACRGRAILIVSDRANGVIATGPLGSHGFGYDPVFYFPELGRTFAELSSIEKNQYSHRGKAFRTALHFLNETVSLRFR
jgi:XTP/dITP diphosphohydrolase